MTRLPDLRRAELLAYRVLAARHVTSLPVDPLTMLRACHDTTVLTCDEAAERLSMPSLQFDRLFDRTDAVTYQLDHGGRCHYIVVYQPGGNPARLRFTIAHELGHRLMKHTGSDSAEEREADHFASHLLCPEPVIACLRDRHGRVPREEAAHLCYVTESCAQALNLRPALCVDAGILSQVSDLLWDVVKKHLPKR